MWKGKAFERAPTCNLGSEITNSHGKGGDFFSIEKHMEFFGEVQNKKSFFPLARRMRPKDLNEFVGQEDIIGIGKLLRRAIEADRLGSIIFYGPPGSGKTALAHLIASTTHADFIEINAVTAGMEDIRKALDKAEENQLLHHKKTILFIDEIHRFNKLQQDAFMPGVENGLIILIGATIHNPFFSLNSALLSRSQVFEFKSLKEKDLLTIAKRALSDKERGLGKIKVAMDNEAIKHLVKVSDGDARKLLNALEVGVLTTPPDKGTIPFTLKVAEESIQKKIVRYDKDGDEHYDTISAFIKSMRGSDPDASLYWLAKMIYAGEDPRFIARRIVICASEDVGNADPQALVLASAALNAAEFVGFPEARIPLAQATLYVACAPKSNSAYKAIDNAMQDVEKEATDEVPQHLRSASYPGAKKLGRGKGYKYAHDFPQHVVKQKYMSSKKRYYYPTDMGHEKVIKKWLEDLEKMKEKNE